MTAPDYGNAQDLDAAERRRAPRYEVCLIAEIKVDHRIQRAVVTSLGATGGFVQTDLLLAVGSTVQVKIGLGDGHERLRSSARVVNTNRRFGAAVVRGIGFEFVDPPTGLTRRLDEVAPEFPRLVRLEPKGTMSWPVFARIQKIPRDGALVASVNGKWLASTAPPCTQKALPSDEDYVAAIGELVEECEAPESSTIAVVYRGRPLSPQKGLNLGELLESPAIETLVAQMAAIDAFYVHGWRLERAEENTEAWKRARGWLRETRLLLKGSACMSPWLPEARRSLRDVEKTVASVLWAVRASRPGGPMPTSARNLDTGTGATKGVRVKVRVAGKETQNPWAALAAALMALGLLVGTVYQSWVIAERGGVVRHPLDLAVLRAEAPLVTFAIEAGYVEITLPDNWVQRPRDDRFAAFVEMVRHTSDRGYDQVALKNMSGQLLAVAHGSAIRLLE